MQARSRRMINLFKEFIEKMHDVQGFFHRCYFQFVPVDVSRFRGIVLQIEHFKQIEDRQLD